MKEFACSLEKDKDIELSFKTSTFINGETMLQFLHVDDGRCSEYFGGNYEGTNLMLHTIIDNKLRMEKLHMPFGYLAILSNEVCYGGGYAPSILFPNYSQGKYKSWTFNEKVRLLETIFLWCVPNYPKPQNMEVTDEIKIELKKIQLELIDPNNKGSTIAVLITSKKLH